MTDPIPQDLQHRHNFLQTVITQNVSLGPLIDQDEETLRQTAYARNELALIERIARLEAERAALKEAECPDCHYPRDKHCKGIGLTEEQENQYIPCEYCSLKAQLSQAQQRVRELEWKLGIV